MTDNNIEKIYEKSWTMIGELLEKYSPLEVAGVMVVQAMTMYKTALSDEEYDAMCTAISNSRDSVKKIDIPVIQ